MQVFVKIILLTLCLTQATFAGFEIVLTAISLDEAKKKIINQSDSKVLGAKTETINGKNVHVIKVLTRDGHVQYLKVDETTGKITK